jgi:hypothetical protein
VSVYPRNYRKYCCRVVLCYYSSTRLSERRIVRVAEGQNGGNGIIARLFVGRERGEGEKSKSTIKCRGRERVNDSSDLCFLSHTASAKKDGDDEVGCVGEERGRSRTRGREGKSAAAESESALVGFAGFAGGQGERESEREREREIRPSPLPSTILQGTDPLWPERAKLQVLDKVLSAVIGGSCQTKLLRRRVERQGPTR